MDKIEKWEGVAFSCLAALVTGFLMTEHAMPTTVQWYIWGIFIVVCGLSIAPPTTLTVRDLLTVGLPPALCLLVMLLIRGALSVILNSAFAQVASMDLTPAQLIEVQNLQRVAGVYAIILIGTVPAIILAAIARGIIWRVIKSIWDADPKRVSRLEKVINTVLRIAALLGGGVLIGRF